MAKPKKLSYRLIPETSPMYRLLAEIVDAHHPELQEAKIALAWNLTWKPDVDGRVTLGKCKKASDLDRELASWDFVIVLRQEFWDDPMATDQQRRALLDHELMHAAVKLDDHNEPIVDEKGRTVYRIRKHDLEEFSEIADRYGCWKRDLEVFAQALDRARHAVGDRWVGYRSLHEELSQAGVSIPLEIIHEWSDDERREASTFAVVRQQCLPGTMEKMPAFLERAVFDAANKVGA